MKEKLDVNVNNLKIVTKSVYKESQRVNLITLASSSSFYLILTFIPTMLLLTRLVGLFIPEGGQASKVVTGYLGLFIPSHLEGAIEMIGGILSKALYAKGSYTFFNFAVLATSCFGFINSIWRNLAIITHDKSYNSVKKYYKGIIFLAIGLIFLLCVFFLPMLIGFLISLLKFPFIMNILEYFNVADLYTKVLGYIESAKYISYLLTLVFASVFFKFILLNKVDFKRAFLGAFIFTSLLSIVRVSFYLYANMVTSGLLNNYGASYIVVLMYIWVFLSMILFYSSIVVSLEMMKFKLKGS